MSDDPSGAVRDGAATSLPAWRAAAAWFEALGEPPGEDATASIARRTLILGGVLMSVGGVLWSFVAAAVFDRTLQAMIPLSYVVLTAVNFARFARRREFARTRFVQVLLSLLLPFAFQWSLGGFASSGTVMIWSMVALVGSLTFSSARESSAWLGVFCGLTVLSGVIDPLLGSVSTFTPSVTARLAFVVVNVTVVCAVVFSQAIYLNSHRAAATRSLHAANVENVALNGRLADEVTLRGAQLAELRALQGELIRQEKLAALGQLVAGVAHELNTPLGVSYTAVTLSNERLAQLAETLASPTLSRRRINELIASTREALEMASVNAARAASLIASFKSIAVDQTSEAERSIDVGAYLASLVTSLTPMLRSGRLELELDTEPVVAVTLPGAIAQVVTNLLQNVALHAYTDDGPRRVRLGCRGEASAVVITVEDYGVGMEPDLARRMFEPFVTTKRGVGGSGLGLHIVHQSVYEVLQGTLDVRTAPGEGTRFTLRLPLDRRAARPVTLA